MQPQKKKLHRTNQGSNLLEAVLAGETMQEPRSNLEEKDNRNILEDDFSSRTNVKGQIKQVKFF